MKEKRHKHKTIYANEQPVCSALAGFCKNSARSIDSMVGGKRRGGNTEMVWCLPSLDDFRDNAKIVLPFVRRGRFFHVLFTLAFSALQWRSKETAKQYNRESNKSAAKIHSTEVKWKKEAAGRKKSKKKSFSKPTGIHSCHKRCFIILCQTTTSCKSISNGEKKSPSEEKRKANMDVSALRRPARALEAKREKSWAWKKGEVTLVTFS